MLLIPVPEVSNATLNLQLGGLEYTFIYSYNERDARWRFDLYLQDTPVITGVKIVESQFFFSKYILSGFDHGDIACIRTGSSKDAASRDNVGIGKNYELVYFTNEEIANL